MRKPEPPKVDKEKEKLQKQISETLNSARRLIADELGWDKDTVETAKYGFKLKYKLSPEDYVEKYTLSSSAAKNAYNFDDLSKVIRLYSPDSTLNDLVALAEACSFFAVEARRSIRPDT